MGCVLEPDEICPFVNQYELWGLSCLIMCSYERALLPEESKTHDIR